MQRSISLKYVLLLLAVPVALLFLCGFLLLAYLLLADSPFLLTGDDGRRDAPVALVDEAEADVAAGMTLSEALAVTPEDARPVILEEMGPPDAFTLHFEQLEGETVRWEAWSYFDFQTRFDFIDGELLWRTELEPVPDGSIYAHFYDPADFRAGMSMAAVEDLLGAQAFAEMDLEAGDIDGGRALVGEQILLGFQDNRLVFVETVILTPDDGAEPLALAPMPDPAATPTVEMPPPILQDNFSGPPRPEIANDTDFRAFDNIDGRGRMTFSGQWGGMTVIYDTPRPVDFMARVDFDVSEVAADGRVGLLFRGEERDGALNSFYFLAIKPVEREVVLSVLLDDGEQNEALQAVSLPEGIQPQDGIYQLVLICHGSDYRVFVNNEFVTVFSDRQILAPGVLGLALLHPGPVTVFVDDLVVYPISSGE